MPADCECRITIALSCAAGPVGQVKGICGPSRGVGAHGSAGKGTRSERMAIAMAMVLPG
jgi:hypothetical protein